MGAKSVTGGIEMNRYFFTIFCVVVLVLGVVGSSCQAAEKQRDYVIGCGDVLEILTWKEDSFSIPEALVRTDGKITIPLINDIQAAGKTPMELQKDIEARLKAYVTNPEVTVTVRDPASHKFYILGEIQHTGEYPLTKRLTVLQAFALAGGFTEWASKDEILLLRKKDGKDITIRINYKELADGENLKQNVYIQADDTIIVP